MAAGQGLRGAGAPIAVVLLAALLLRCADAAVYTVGDATGWTFGVSGWPNGKTFHAGDQLVFKYSPDMHNVAIVDAAGFNACSAAPGARIFTSGNDVVTIGGGTTFFICTIPGHCQAGMKIAVNAS